MLSHCLRKDQDRNPFRKPWSPSWGKGCKHAELGTIIALPPATSPCCRPAVIHEQVGTEEPWLG